MQICEETGKKCYNYADARYVINSLKTRRRHRKTPTGKVPKRCYLCEFCGQYHLTSKHKESRKKK